MDITYIYTLLNNFGIFNIFGPFLVIFSLIYGLLRKIPIFSKKERIAIIISLVFTLYYIADINLLLKTQKMFSMFFYEILTIFLILIASSLFLNPSNKSDNKIKNITAGVFGLTVIIAALYAFRGDPQGTGSAAQSVLSLLYKYFIQEGLFSILILFGSFYLLVRWISSPPKKKEKKEKLSKKIKDYAVVPVNILEEIMKKE